MATVSNSQNRNFDFLLVAISGFLVYVDFTRQPACHSSFRGSARNTIQNIALLHFSGDLTV
jgi:hypothetical protein